MGLIVKCLAQGTINATSGGASAQIIYPNPQTPVSRGALIKSIALTNPSASGSQHLNLQIRAANMSANERFVLPPALVIPSYTTKLINMYLTLSLASPQDLIIAWLG